MIKKIITLLILCCSISALYYYKKQKLDTTDQSTETSLHHLAIIMDGNRRWARERNLKPWLGHKQGIEAVKIAVQFCIKKNIPYLSLYAFSLENFKRSAQELEYLFDILAQELAGSILDECLKHNIKMVVVGDRTQFPAQLRETLNKIEKLTENNTHLYLNILFCYGGRQEINAAVKKIISENIPAETITDETLTHHMWNSSIPDPDLIIRTGNTHRLSNFMLYQAAYSELYFMDCYWPDVTEKHLQQAVDSFTHSQRRFGA